VARRASLEDVQPRVQAGVDVLARALGRAELRGCDQGRLHAEGDMIEPLADAVTARGATARFARGAEVVPVRRRSLAVRPTRLAIERIEAPGVRHSLLRVEASGTGARRLRVCGVLVRHLELAARRELRIGIDAQLLRPRRRREARRVRDPGVLGARRRLGACGRGGGGRRVAREVALAGIAGPAVDTGVLDRIDAVAAVARRRGARRALRLARGLRARLLERDRWLRRCLDDRVGRAGCRPEDRHDTESCDGQGEEEARHATLSAAGIASCAKSDRSGA